MATHKTPPHSSYVYKEINVGKFIATRHYKCSELEKSKSKLTTLINISKDRKCAKSSPIYWLQIRVNNKWQKPRLTGLFKTSTLNVFYGDIDKCKHLLLFKFSDHASTFTIKYFENYYTKDLTNLLPLFKD